MRIAFLLERTQPDNPTPRINPVTADVIADLRERGVQADLMVPENGCVEISDARPRHDLYVLKSKTPLALSLAGALAMAGARIVNTVEACTLVRDKITCTAVLAARGVPVPPSWATGQAASLLPLLDEGPLWVKPQRGSKGRGVLRVEGPAGSAPFQTHLDRCGLPLPLFAQREVPSDGGVLKVYVVGDRAWAVAKPWPARTVEDKVGRPASLPPEIEAAALAGGQVLGLEIYGVDFLVHGGQFAAVDVNAWPGFRGPAEAPPCIAAYLYERARRPDVPARGPAGPVGLVAGPAGRMGSRVSREAPAAPADGAGVPA